jgi:hypothetical protein
MPASRLRKPDDTASTTPAANPGARSLPYEALAFVGSKIIHDRAGALAHLPLMEEAGKIVGGYFGALREFASMRILDFT